MKSVLITGGSGLVGSNVAEFFNKKGYEVYTADLKEKPSKNHIICDLAKINEINKLPEKVDYILHFAAYIDEKDENKEHLITNNALSTLNILEYALKSGVKKVIYSSSSSIYGKSEEYPIKENFEKNPQSIYAISKYFGEELCNLYRSAGLPIIIFRLGYVLAPVIPERYFIYKIMEKLSKNEPIKIVNGEKTSMSFVNVEDITEFCEEGLEGGMQGDFNLTGQEVKSKKVINLLLNNFKDYSGDIIEEENDEIMKNEFSEEKLYSVFNKRYNVSIEESIKRITQNFKYGISH